MKWNKRLFGPNKNVDVRTEWGLGDTMQFIRYVQLLRKFEPKKIIVQTFGPLKQLFAQCNYIDELVESGQAFPHHDLQIPQLSLPLLFKTTAQTIPAQIPYLQADPDLVQFWKNYLEQIEHETGPIRVGLCWQAKPDIFIEHNPLTKRSVPLALFAPLGKIKNVQLYSLQQRFGVEQLQNLPDNFFVQSFDETFDVTNGRFMDTAAVIRNLDLVISVDTAIVHLAGALGVPVWILVPSVAEWRWMTSGATTPWYPNALIFRQEKTNDWESVIQKIKMKLIDFAKHKNGKIV